MFAIAISRIKPLFVALSLSGIFLSGITACAQKESASGDFDGQAKLLAHLALKPPLGTEHPFRGISGLDYDRHSRSYFAISDDRAERGPARYFRFVLDKNFQLAQLETFPLLDANGEPFNPKEVDGESIRYLGDGQFIWSSELGADRPGIYLTDAGGVTTSPFVLPDYLYPTPSQAMGARPNKFIEGMTVTPDRKFVIVALEAPLQQDAQLPDADRGGPSRILVFETRTRRLVAEYIYELDPIPEPSRAKPAIHDNGISEILALDKESLLVLERSGRHIGEMDFNFNNRVYIANLADATNIRGIESLREKTGSAFKSTGKKLLLPLAEFIGEKQANFEGMSFGPEIDGKRTLYLISDDNFHPNHTTSLLVFRLPIELQPPTFP